MKKRWAFLRLARVVEIKSDLWQLYFSTPILLIAMDLLLAECLRYVGYANALRKIGTQLRFVKETDVYFMSSIIFDLRSHILD